MSILEQLYEMQQDGKLCDVKLLTSTGEFALSHACILSAASPILDKMIEEQKGQEKLFILKLPANINMETLKLLLHFIYTSGIGVTEKGNSNQSSEYVEINEEQGVKFIDGATSLGLQLKEDGPMLVPKSLLPKRNRRKRRNALKYTEETKLVKKKHKKDGPIDSEINHIGSVPENDSTNNDNEVLQVQTVESNTATFSCDLCGKVLKSRTTWQRHLEKCPKKIKMPCPKCDRTFVSQLKLDSHLQRHLQRSTCTICQKSFTSAYVMKLHKRTHSGNERFACNICGKKFPYKSSLTMHTYIHTGERPFMCSFCGKSFTQKVHAKEHESQHVGEKLFKCDNCDKQFAHKSGLVRHISDFHLKSRPYVCDTCGRAFPRQEKLTEHIRIHTGEKPYICALCGVSYKSNRSLKNHKKSKHNLIVPDYQIGITKLPKANHVLNFSKVALSIQEGGDVTHFEEELKKNDSRFEEALNIAVEKKDKPADIPRNRHPYPLEHHVSASNAQGSIVVASPLPTGSINPGQPIVSPLHPPYQLTAISMGELSRKLLDNFIPVGAPPLPALVLPSAQGLQNAGVQLMLANDAAGQTTPSTST